MTSRRQSHKVIPGTALTARTRALRPAPAAGRRRADPAAAVWPVAVPPAGCHGRPGRGGARTFTGGRSPPGRTAAAGSASANGGRADRSFRHLPVAAACEILLGPRPAGAAHRCRPGGRYRQTGRAAVERSDGQPGRAPVLRGRGCRPGAYRPADHGERPAHAPHALKELRPDADNRVGRRTGPGSPASSPGGRGKRRGRNESDGDSRREPEETSRYLHILIPKTSGGRRFSEGDAARYYAEYVRFVKEASAHQAGTVLDLGCGNGWSSYCLAKAGYDVTGLDLNAGLLRAAARARTCG